MNELLMQSLQLMGKGMLGIFIVIGIIYFVVLALTKLTAQKPSKE
ncbi:MAG: OadG-related small transporter subunit [Hydrogenoanaerobacterium sp.]